MAGNFPGCQGIVPSVVEAQLRIFCKTVRRHRICDQGDPVGNDRHAPMQEIGESWRKIAALKWSRIGWGGLMIAASGMVTVLSDVTKCETICSGIRCDATSQPRPALKLQK